MPKLSAVPRSAAAWCTPMAMLCWVNSRVSFSVLFSWVFVFVKAYFYVSTSGMVSQCILRLNCKTPAVLTLWLFYAAHFVMAIFGFGSAMSIELLHYCLWWLNQRTGRLRLPYIAPTQSTSDITIMRTIAKHCLATSFLTHANIGGLPASRTSVLSRVVHRRFCCI